MKTDKVTLKIPRPLYNKLKKIIQKSGFSSVNEFVVYVLRDLASTEGNKEELSSEEIKIIRKRLEKLGYL
ncbi:MAG: CopG family transcriptional regulator [candidate division WOR-3 bacterium]